MMYQIPGATGQWETCDHNGDRSNNDHAIVFVGPFRIFVGTHIPPFYRADMSISAKGRNAVLLGDFTKGIEQQKREAIVAARAIFVQAVATCDELLK